METNTLQEKLLELTKELKEIKKEMKEKQIKKISCFNAGLSADEYRYNTKLFEIKTKISVLVDKTPAGKKCLTIRRK